MSMSVKTKLILLLFVPLILSASCIVYLLQANSSLNARLSSILYDVSYQSSSLVLNADRDMYQALTDYQRIRGGQLSEEVSKQTRDDFELNIKQVHDRVGQALAIMDKHGLTGLSHPDSKETIATVIDRYQDGFEVWVKQARTNLDLKTVNAEQETTLLATFERGREGINTFGEFVDNYAQTEKADQHLKTKKERTFAFVIMSIEWLIIIVAGFYLIQHLSRTIRHVLGKVRQVSAGDLRQEPMRTYGKDELGQINASVDEMVSKVRQLIVGISSQASTVSFASLELASGANESASASIHIAESIQDITNQVDVQSTIAEESSRAMEEMAIGVQRIAESTAAIAQHASSTSEEVNLGHERVRTLKDQMDDILEAIGQLSRIVASLTIKSDRINQITENITGFANQTNILSLNASIEAARAGEHGRGFAVVAQEIRKLAASSLTSADDISGLITETRNEIASVSHYMEATLSHSQAGQETMEKVGEAFEVILASIKQVSLQVHETSAVTEQMSASSEEVSASMDQAASSAQDVAGRAQSVAAATEEQLALGENISHAAERLQDIVKELNGAIAVFKV